MDNVTTVNFHHYCSQVLNDAGLVLAHHFRDDDAIEVSVRRITLISHALQRRADHLDVRDLLHRAAAILDHLSDAELHLQLATQNHSNNLELQPVFITAEILQFLRAEGYSVMNIASKLRVSRTTIYNKIQQFGLVEEVSEFRMKKILHVL